MAPEATSQQKTRQPPRRRAEDAACSKPGVHVSESPGRFCSCDKAANRGVVWVAWGGQVGWGLCVLRYVVKKQRAPNSKTSPNPPTKIGEEWKRPFFLWMVSFERMLKEKQMFSLILQDSLMKGNPGDTEKLVDDRSRLKNASWSKRFLPSTL